MADSRRKEKDAVTVGQIRSRHLQTLEKQIGELGNLIRNGGYHQICAAETFLKEDILRTLTTLDNLDALASVVVLFPDQV